MGRVDYTLKHEGEKAVRAMIYEVNMSTKASREICRALRGMSLKKAKEYLEEVVQLKRPVPFRRYNQNVAHRRNMEGWDAGRYPQKAAREFLALIKNAEGNAEYKGLDPEKMRIIHVTSKKGRVFKSVYPRAMGRATAKHGDRVTVEMIVEEVE